MLEMSLVKMVSEEKLEEGQYIDVNTAKIY